MMVSIENDPRRAGTIWMLNLDEETPVVDPLIDAKFGPLNPDFIPALAAIRGGDSLAEFQQRFATGRRCYGAWVTGELAAFGWVSHEEEGIGELNLRIRLLPGEVYLWDFFTVHSYEGKRLYSALLAHILSDLRIQRLCRAWIGADFENVPSQRGIARAGFHHVADLLIERVLAIRQVWVMGLPGVSDSIVAEARRAFLNDRDKVWTDFSSSFRAD